MNTPCAILVCFLFVAAGDDAETPVGVIIAAHNRERAERKLPPLRLDSRLQAAAKVHAADMAKRGIMEHESGDKSSPADRVKQQKYPYMTTAENVAQGQKTVDVLMRAWMNSPHHRENILGNFTEMGVARHIAEDGTPFWCAEFGMPFPLLDAAKAEAEVFDRLNHARGDGGVDPLKLDPRLAKAAREVAIRAAKAEVAAKGVASPNAATDRLEKSGYLFEKAAQCDSSGTPTPDSLIRVLFDNDAQRKTLLGGFADCGVGYASADDGRPFWCVILAKPRTEKP